MMYPFFGAATARSLKKSILKTHSFRNGLHSAILIATLSLFFAGAGFVLFGLVGVIAAIVGLAFLYISSQNLPQKWLWQRLKATPLNKWNAPQILQMTEELARAADLAAVPKLYVMQSNIPNAFAISGNRETSIGLTTELINRLNYEQLQGVLAHEIAHIAGGDTKLLAASRLMSGFISNMSVVGGLFLIISLPIAITTAAADWLALGAVLVSAPMVTNLLSLALSRTREFDADRRATELVGSPKGLIEALQKISAGRGNLFAYLNPRKALVPVWIRSHPATKERIRRLNSYEEQSAPRYYRMHPEHEYLLYHSIINRNGYLRPRLVPIKVRNRP